VSQTGPYGKGTRYRSWSREINFHTVVWKGAYRGMGQFTVWYGMVPRRVPGEDRKPVELSERTRVRLAGSIKRELQGYLTAILHCAGK